MNGVSATHAGASAIVADMDARERRGDPVDPVDPYRLYSRQEAAEFLRVSVKWLDEMVKRGELYNVRTGKRRLFPRAALVAFVRGETFSPQGSIDADDTTTWPPTPSIFNKGDE